MVFSPLQVEKLWAAFLHEEIKHPIETYVVSPATGYEFNEDATERVQKTKVDLHENFDVHTIDLITAAVRLSQVTTHGQIREFEKKKQKIVEHPKKPWPVEHPHFMIDAALWRNDLPGFQADVLVEHTDNHARWQSYTFNVHNAKQLLHRHDTSLG